MKEKTISILWALSLIVMLGSAEEFGCAFILSFTAFAILSWAMRDKSENRTKVINLNESEYVS